jgi:hypothetical protein
MDIFQKYKNVHFRKPGLDFCKKSGCEHNAAKSEKNRFKMTA